MTRLFTTVLNMSITASYIALAVLIIRLFFKKLPKFFSYVLWLPVLFRLVCPFSFNSANSFLGLINPNAHAGARAMEYVPQNLGLMQSPEIDTGIRSINNLVNPLLPAATPTASVNPVQVTIWLLSIVWAAGMAVLLAYSIISYIKIMGKVKTATLVKDNIFETDRINTPFLCGFIRPRIYIPVGVSENELTYILAHEQTHIKRLDHLIKPFAFLVLIIHWFNPLMWISFVLMTKDMEMSCDENVLIKMGSDIRCSYSSSLLSLSVKKSGLSFASPLAFGENSIKSRIKNILRYKKPALWVIVIITAVTATLISAFVTNPKHSQTAPNTYHGYPIDRLISNKTPYLGFNGKADVLFADSMPLPKGVSDSIFKLQTQNKPYELTITYIMKDTSEITVQDRLTFEPFYKNAIVLFSLIDNVDIINLKITDKANKQGEVTYSNNITREFSEKLIGQDVRYYNTNADTLKELIDKLNNTSVEDQRTLPQKQESAP